MDWRQLWEICSAPDNVPIVGLIPLLIFYIYLAWKQAKANDELIGELETNPAMAKTHHRKTWPFRPGWQKEIHVWPFLLRSRVSCRHDRHHHPDGVVDHAERAARRTGESQPDHESGEGALVLSGAAGNAGVLRSLDRGRSHAHA